MLAENLAETYIGVSNPQTVRELASISLESRNLPDSYHFAFVNEKLVSPLTKLSVERYMTKNTLVDQLEYNAFLDIQHWVGQNRSGLVFWLSPPHFERSKQSKVIISELNCLEGHKQLANRSILFDANKEASVAIANQIQEIFSDPRVKYISPEELRRYPIFVNKSYELDEWLPIVEQIIEAHNQWEMISTGEDFIEVEKTVEWARGYVQKGNGVGASTTQNYLGENDLSCPFVLQQGAFGVFGSHSVEGKFVNHCGKCGIEIRKTISKGFVCICGGVYQGC